jgi:hypothetical protein
MASQMANDLARTGTTVYGAGLQGNQAAGSQQQAAGNLASSGGNAAYGAGLNTAQVAGNQQRSAADIGSGFITAGTAQSGLAINTYNQLARIDAEQTANTQKAIAAMAAALSGGTPRVTIG